MEKKSAVYIDAPTRMEEDIKQQALDETSDEEPAKVEPSMRRWRRPASDDEDDENANFSVENAWKMLFNLPNCQQVMITEDVQSKLNILVGVNVTQEFPWKQIKYKYLRDFLFDEVDNGDLYIESLEGFDPENHILIGYAPLLTQNQDDIPEGDPFIFYNSTADAKTALNIIRNIELFERWVMNKRLVKKPRRWVTLGSEDEVKLTIHQSVIEPVDVEIQSIYPLTIPAKKEFAFRKSEDVRDGYIELLPAESVKFDNIIKRRVTIGIQSAPERVDLAQQTDPTFPTNAAAQYLYEIDENEEALDESSEDESSKEKQGASRTPTPASEGPKTPKPPPELSDQIKLLLKTLEFNQVDMYRNDYPLISEQEIGHYSNPYLEEVLCFANISKSYQRYVCGIDWYPTLSGLIVTSYTFSTAATIDLVSYKVDMVQRAVLQPNPILMWSFSDNLNYKLEFESPLEVTVLSFCPHDPNLLFGGTKTGRVIIWDLQNRVQKLDIEEILTTAQAKYRVIISDFLNWTIIRDEDSTVPPATITSLEVSQKAAITGIYWLGQHFYVNSFGKVYLNPDPKSHHKFFITCATDGTFAFWDLDAVTEKKGQGGGGSQQLPKALTQSESAYKNKIMKPVFTVCFNEPVTSIIADTASYSCVVKEPLTKRKNALNFRTELVAHDPREMRQSVITSSFYGRIERVQWLGLYADLDRRENATITTSFSRVHDGPVIAMKKNPFYPDIFVSIGRNVFAVWKEDYNYSPVFWRKRSCDLTSIAWSENRPAVLFLTRIDGNFEAWDILARDDDACLSDVLGGGIVTAISEHRPTEPEKLLGIGDYNSSFRMVKLPRSFYVQVPNECDRLKDYVQTEVARKKSIQAWEQTYNENNLDVIEAKREAEMDARKEMERIEKENLLNAARKAREEAEQKTITGPIANLPYTERMKRLWDELNLNRLLQILMTRKRVNPEQLLIETAMEKERLAYEAAKKDSFIQVLHRVGEEVATIRSRILPIEIPDLQRNDMILSIVNDVMKHVETFDEIVTEADEIINSYNDFDDITYIEFVNRGRHRRQMLNKSLGGNTERVFWYETKKHEQTLNECNWGFEDFVNASEDLLGKEGTTSMYKSSLLEYSEMDTNYTATSVALSAN